MQGGGDTVDPRVVISGIRHLIGPQFLRMIDRLRDDWQVIFLDLGHGECIGILVQFKLRFSNNDNTRETRIYPSCVGTSREFVEQTRKIGPKKKAEDEAPSKV